MRIQDMFERDIDRNINGVIKVGQDDEGNVEQELMEYVVTNELEGHFSTFFEAYDRALDVPTDKIGVWISGFFGSGKSHFLKMLYYLLTNQTTADGRTAAQVLEKRFADPMTATRAKRASQVPTEAILFNIDSKGPSNKDKTAIMQVFARVFYENQGFYGQDLKLARLERHIEQKGLTAAFRSAYEDATGVSWLDDRENYDFNSDEVIEALEAAGVMSEQAATRWFEGGEDVEFSIDSLTDEIRDYANMRAEQNGGQFRLLFMVDEMSQYVANDTNLLLNLQTIVENLGTKCAGRVWVFATGQEAIDEITKVAGDDFSKIIGRFNTRLSLSSSGAGEVIRKRVLAKTPDANAMLQQHYRENASVLKNLFTFKNATQDLAGYEGPEDFAGAFPFVGYQFRLMQNIINELRKQGSSGKHLSAERSMLSGFQEAAQHVEDKDEDALVPLWRFYDTVQSFLESYHRRVIENCAKAAAEGKGLEPEDVNVLKLLFLARWVEREMPTDLENVTTLMTDTVSCDRAALRERTQASLDRLVRQNYIERTGDTYRFLTDDEQEIALAISRTQVDTSRIVSDAADIMFGEIFDRPKLIWGKNQFDVTEYLDNMRRNQADGLVLRVIAGADGTPTPTDEELVLRSAAPEAIVVLPEDEDYYSALMRAAQINQYANTLNHQNLPENQRGILRSKQQERTNLQKAAREAMERAVMKAELYVGGSRVTPTATTSARKRIEDCLGRLVASVYSKLSYIDTSYDSDAELRQILTGTATLAADGMAPNERACAEVSRALELNAKRHSAMSAQDLQNTFQKVPYGWREIDVAAVIAQLVAEKRAKLTYAGKALEPTDPRVADYLRKRQYAEKTLVERRVAVDQAMVSRARGVVKELCGARDLPTDEDGFAKAARVELADKRGWLVGLLEHEYRANPNYPGFNEAVEARKLIDAVLEAGSSSEGLISALCKRADDAEDAADDLQDIADFFPHQQGIFDDATTLKEKMKDEAGYLASDESATAALATIDRYLGNPRLGRFKELSDANATLKAAHAKLLEAKRADLMNQLEQTYATIEAYAAEKDVNPSAIGQAKLTRRGTINDATTLTRLDALVSMLAQDQSKLYAEVEREHERTHRPAPATTGLTATGHAAPAGAGQPGQGAASAPAPKPREKRVVRSTVFTPRSLKSAEEIDAYLARAREALLRSLEGNDAIKLD